MRVKNMMVHGILDQKKKNITVKNIIDGLKTELKSKKKINYKFDSFIKETNLLSLKSKKSNKILKWSPKLNIKKTIKLTGEWYYCFLTNRQNILKLSNKHVKEFFND